MQKAFLYLTLFASMIVFPQSVWKADRSDSKIGFTISHLVFSKVEGHFENFEIEAKASDDFSNPTFEVKIWVASIDTGKADRDDNLKEDYFNAEEYPAMIFSSDSFRLADDSTFELGGKLTIKGISKHVTLRGKFIQVPSDEKGNNLPIKLKLEGTINRKDFGVGGSTLIPMGDEVNVKVHLEMLRQ